MGGGLSPILPGVTTRWHRLRGVTERYLILKGQGRVEVGEEPPAKVGPEAMVLIPPETAQRITHNRQRLDLIFLAICTPRFIPSCYQDVEARWGARPVARSGVALHP